MFFKVGALKDFVIFTKKPLRWSFSLIKLQKRLQHRSFLVNTAKNFKNSFFYRTSQVVASAQWKHIIFFTLLLLIHVWCHFHFQHEIKKVGKLSKICYANYLFQHLKNPLKDAKPATLIKLIKIPSHIFFLDFATSKVK